MDRLELIKSEYKKLIESGEVDTIDEAELLELSLAVLAGQDDVTEWFKNDNCA